jgi:hypothetical protein
MIRLFSSAPAVCAALMLGAAPASAATISVATFAAGEAAAARAAWDALVGGWGVSAVETFETLSEADLGATAVGAFSTGGRNGSGASSIARGAALDVRSSSFGARYGRMNLTAGPGADTWLDSNDRESVTMTLGGVGTFDRVAFFLTDVGDVSGRFRIDVAGTAQAIGRQANGTINLVSIRFDGPESAADIRFTTARNDGFGIDDVAVGRQVAAIPLPATLPMLVGGLIGVALLSRARAR